MASHRIGWFVLGPFFFLAEHRQLILHLAVRQVKSNYRGSIFGFLWALVQPILMLAVYTFVFSVVFEMRWGIATGSRAEFSLVLFSGLIVFNLVAHGLQAATGIIRSNPSYVKKVVFPLEVLTVVAVMEGLFFASVSYFVLVVAAAVTLGIPFTGVVLAPIMTVPLVAGLLGTTWLLAALGAYLRDLGQVISVVTLVLLFMCPIFYPMHVVPEAYRWVIQTNPLTWVVTWVRSAFFQAELPSVGGFGLALVVGFGLSTAGFHAFRRAKGGFSDVV